jgi:DNA-binding GntR family transcriptional regulator
MTSTKTHPSIRDACPTGQARRQAMQEDPRARRAQKINPRKFERLQWDPGLRERKTTTDYLAAALRTAIYDGQFVDGEELNQVELASYFHVSRVPIREALRQLQAEGLVRIVAHHQTVVAGLTLSQILESIEMRAVLEGFIVRKGGPNLEKSAVKRLRDLCDEMDRIGDYGSRWVLKNWEFHRIFYAAANSHTMTDAVERIQLNIERYTRRAGTLERQRQAAVEHRQIVQAVERKDFAKASALMERHVLRTGDEIRKHLEQKQDPKPRKASARRAGSR